MIPKNNLNLRDKESIRKIFRSFAEKECKKIAPFYALICEKIAEDEALLQLVSHCRIGQPPPNLFLGAVHFLLLKNPLETLAEYYPSLGKRAMDDEFWVCFRGFCLSNEETIIEIIQNKIVQTNALNRTAYLMPIIAKICEAESVVNLIDIGTSGGLTLNMDAYEYHYSSQHRIGESGVKISSEIVGGSPPNFKNLPQIRNKIGLDQNPLDLKNEEHALWLKALIWPDETERFQRLDAAIQLVKVSDNQLIKADAVEAFKEAILSQDEKGALVVYHTHALYQFSKQEREKFWAMLDEVGQQRDFHYLAVEGANVLRHDYGQKGVLIELATHKSGHRKNRLLGETDGHANWIKWHDE